MRKRYVVLLCMLFVAALLNSKINAQTNTFSKISPRWNETLWKKDYTYTWMFSWNPYTGGAAFDHYVIKFFNNSNVMVKQITVPGGAGATSMLIDFTNMTEITKGNTYYTWSLGAYNGTNATPVAEADSMPSSSSTKSGFRVPLYTADTKTWTVNATIKCPQNTVLNRNVRTFWTAWTEGQNHPWEFNWNYGAYSKNLTRSQGITNRTSSDTVYFGLESDLIVTKKLYSGANTQEPQELIPTGLPWATSMDQGIIYEGTWFNPYTAMTAWRRDLLPNGSYSVAFAVPTPYDTQWCVTPSPAPVQCGGFTCAAGEVCVGNACRMGCTTDANCVAGLKCQTGGCVPATTTLTLSAGQEVCLGTYDNPTVGTPYDSGDFGKINITYKTTGTGNASFERRSYWSTGTLGSKATFTLPGSANFVNSSFGTIPNSAWTGVGTVTLKVKNSGTVPIEIAKLTVYGAFSETHIMGTYPSTSTCPGSSSSSGCVKTNGDANCDGVVNDADYTIWKCEYLGSGTCASPASTKTADFNSSGGVDLVDFEIWRSHKY